MPNLGRLTPVLGYAKESVRNTAITTATSFFGVTDFSFDVKNNYFENNSMYGRREGLYAKEITQQWAEGSVSGFLDVDGFLGPLLFHALGTDTPVTALGATSHTFSFVQNIVAPTCTLQYSKADVGVLAARGVGVKTLTIDVTDKDCTFQADLIALAEGTGNAQTVTITKPTRHLLGKNLTFKNATNIAGLTGATAVPIRKFNIKIDTGLDYDPDMAPGSVNRLDTRSGTFMVEVTFSGTIRSNTFYNNFVTNTKNAFEFDINATNLPALGTSALFPRLRFRVPPSTVEVTSSYPMDDLIMFDAKVNAEFTVTDAYMLEVLLQNTTATY